YKLVSPVNLKGKVSKTNKGLYLDIDVNFTIVDNCSRCLKEVEIPLEYSIQGFLVKEEDYDEDEFEEFDPFIFDGEEIDLIDIIEQTLDFNVPHKVLCSENCKGLCQVCGANLNEEECSCSEITNDEEYIDPRFAKLKDLFN
ncbi:DUF177 domain-containing protein, partial [Clostridioides difficile]